MRDVFLIAPLLCSLIGCGSGQRITTPTKAQIAEFVSNAGIVLPASSRPTGWLEERGMDDALWLRVEMPASDFPEFIRNSPFANSSLSENGSLINYDMFLNFDTFLKTPPKKYRGGSEELPNARVLNLLVDESDPAEVTVYLMWHET